ncbi:acetyl-CoA hydrolase/transferase family protein [Aliivibrio fischeri]|uniref:acetyl-CoA hydrolase/transferase family protein n=1 Tax=Aliivibrio fischeri TaxID=668 RepID=UPI0002EDD602|nr:acetyl-CoA hydrolase/transferase C-terminal domain-containing protein [Aliivibrio fischeri]OCH07626.1 4-hydroxybutyrate CoA transferase [Aliivibrio fischeri]OCH29126.1 4-hydroxybutyrate CoA transferase [Aliivibrio fischeri]OEE12292.1 4-hydroxybutyrate CoA transferase [Aliivibrio fischeri ZF-211]
MNKLNFVSMSEAVSEITSGDRLWVSGAIGVSYEFLTTLEKMSSKLKDVEIISGMILNPKQEFMLPEYKGRIYYRSLFLGPLERAMRSLGNMELNTTHYSSMKDLFLELKPNVVALEVSPPDDEGFCSLGPIGGLGSQLMASHAEKVILIVNENVPHCGGYRNCIHLDEATTVTTSNLPLIAIPSEKVSDTDIQIGEIVADIVDDGCTLQIGIGSISNAVGYALKNKKNIKIHTEMLTSSMVELIQAGAVDPTANVTCTLAMGDQNLLDYLKTADNLVIEPCYEVTDPYLVSKHDCFTSVNTCIAVDLTGQVTAEGMGYRQISGTGGAYDFARAAKMSKGGKSIIALKSAYTNKEGDLISNIMVGFPEGTPVTYLRSDVDYIATEYGVVRLMNKSYEERTELLISIAHPDLREHLKSEAIKSGLIH